MSKLTQYDRILVALLLAGKNGLTTAELAHHIGSNCVWKRVNEMPVWHQHGAVRYYIDKSSRLIGSRHVRVYRLVRA